ncbi:MAG: hypothetical protein G01um101493_390 [Microgenomates group bacterium Gr01-1014_93]|nr:MAG: hypothetical protein G01um101493_390 [Microgenomates group bacterium Gr01-1014_93]
MLNQDVYLNLKLFDEGVFMHQKTVLANGFNASIGSKLSTASQTGLALIYHKIINLSTIKKHLRGPDGIRTRISCLRYRQSTIDLPAQITEVAVLCQSHK